MGMRNKLKSFTKDFREFRRNYNGVSRITNWWRLVGFSACWYERHLASANSELEPQTKVIGFQVNAGFFSVYVGV